MNVEAHTHTVLVHLASGNGRLWHTAHAKLPRSGWCSMRDLRCLL